jgi:hypothetical protein
MTPGTSPYNEFPPERLPKSDGFGAPFLAKLSPLLLAKA